MGRIGLKNLFIPFTGRKRHGHKPDRSVPSPSSYSWNKQHSPEKGTKVKQKRLENQIMEKKIQTTGKGCPSMVSLYRKSEEMEEEGEKGDLKGISGGAHAWKNYNSKIDHTSRINTLNVPYVYIYSKWLMRNPSMCCCSVLVLKGFPGKRDNVFHLEEEVLDIRTGRQMSWCSWKKKGVRSSPTFEENTAKDPGLPINVSHGRPQAAVIKMQQPTAD